MRRTQVQVEQIIRLLPELEELENFRALLSRAAEPDHEKQWASSRAYSTVDKRVVRLADAEAALQEAERALQQQIREMTDTFRKLLHRFWDGDDAGAADCLIRLGEAEEGRGRHARARRLFEAALQLSLPLPDRTPQILVLRRLGRLLLGQGDLLEALPYYERSAELARDTNDARGEVIALTGSGNVCLFQGRWADADACYRAALDRLDHSDVAALRLERGQLFNNLGTVATRQGRWAEAEDWFARALRIWNDVNSPVDLGIHHHNLGLLRQAQGRAEEARAAFQEALGLEIPAYLRAAVATDLARSFLADKMVSLAEEWGRVAEEHAIAAQVPYYLGHMYAGLGTIARGKGDEGGITFFEKALEIARGRTLPLLEGEVLIEYALLRAQIGEAEEARSYLERARHIFQRTGARVELRRAEQELARIALPRLEAGG